MTDCLYFPTNWAKASLSPCFTRNIRAASGSCSADIRANSNKHRLSHKVGRKKASKSNNQTSRNHQNPRLIQVRVAAEATRLHPIEKPLANEWPAAEKY